MLSNKEILERVKNKLSGAELPFDDVVKRLHFGKDFSSEGIYVYSDSEKYYLKEVGARDKQNIEHVYTDENELILVITWNCLVTYIYETNRFKPDSKQLAFNYLQRINEEYYGK